MCVSCGCCLPATDHDDPRHITASDLRAAAEAANTTVATVAHNVESYAMHHAGEAQKTADEAGHNSDGYSPEMTAQQLRHHLWDVHQFEWKLPEDRDELDRIHVQDHSARGECGAHEESPVARVEKGFLTYREALEAGGAEVVQECESEAEAERAFETFDPSEYRCVGNCIVVKSSDDSPRIGGVLKAVDEDQFLLVPVYSPNRMPLRGADGKTDVASPRVLEKACWMWMAKGARTGMWHEDGHGHEAVCVENYIYRNPEPWVVKHADGTKTVIKEGDWLAGFVLSDHAWGLYKSGRLGGVSMQGGAGRMAPSAETLARSGGVA